MLALLPLQYVATLLVEEYTTLQMWPALLFPSFSKVYEDGDQITVKRPALYATTAAGDTVAVAVSELLAHLPTSHHRAVMQRVFGRHYRAPGSPIVFPTASKAWLQDRLATLLPGAQVVYFEVRWMAQQFARSGQTLQPLSSMVEDRFGVALAAR